VRRGAGLPTGGRLARGWRFLSCAFVVAGGASEDGGRRYVARSEQAARLARPKGAPLTSKSQFPQSMRVKACLPSADVRLMSVG